MKRITTGLFGSLSVAAVSLILLTAALQWAGQSLSPFYIVVHWAAGMSLAWALLALVVHPRGPAAEGRTSRGDLEAVLDVAVTVTSLLVVILMVYVATVEALCRTPYSFDYHTRWHVPIWTTGFIDLALVAAATVICWGRTRDRQLVTVCFWIFVLAGLWLSLRIPAVRMVATESGGFYRKATAWTVPFLVWNSLLIATFVLAEEIVVRRRHIRAWPDALGNLLVRYEPWPGFRYSVGIVSVLLLVLGCIHIVTFWAWASALVVGIALLFMISRQWEPNLGDLAVGLISLAIVSLTLTALPVHGRPTAHHFADIFNRAIIGLAIATWFWHWLAAVWTQQLDQGVAWTTAGRLIRNARRIGYLCAATGVLVALHLAFWPLLPIVQTLDNAPSRWVWSLLAYPLLFGALFFAAHSTRKSTLAWLSLFVLVAGGAFTIIRLGDAPFAQWWSLYWPLAMPVLTLVMWPLALAARRSRRWSHWHEPLFLSGTLVAPLAGISGVSFANHLMTPAWALPTEMGIFSFLYLALGLAIGPRAFLIPGTFLLVLTVWHLL